MTEFKVGDKVRYVGSGKTTISPQYIGVEAVVTEAWGTSVSAKITKPISNDPEHFVVVGKEFYPFTSNLELVTDFTFSDIRKGDTIRRTALRTDDSKVIWEGKAHRKNNAGDSWLSLDNFHLAYMADARHAEISLELLERPEPPHWAYTKPVGSLALHTVVEGAVVTAYRKTSETEWETNLITYGQIHRKSLESLANDLRNLEAEKLEWIK